MKRMIIKGLVVALALGLASNSMAQTVRIGAKSEPVMDPHFQWNDANVGFYKHIYGGLTSIDTKSQVIPGLADSWESVSPTDWVFHLNRNAKFHDGQSVTARDVVASFNRMRTIKAVATFAGAVASLKEITAVDDHTVRLSFAASNPLAPIQVNSIQIIPERLADATGEAFSSGKAAIGFGPYKLASIRQGDSIVVERNPDYFRTKSQWERVTFRFIADAGARVAALLGGDVDFIDAVPPALVERIKNEKGFQVITGPSSRTIALNFDVKRDQTPFVTDKDGKPLSVNPLRDVRVRRALSHAIDRNAITQRVMGGLAFPAAQLTPEGYGGYDASIVVPKYDPELARKLLAEAGYPQGFGLTLHCTNDRYVEDAKNCQAIGQMFARIGLKTSVQTFPVSVYSPRMMDAKGERYSVAMTGWSDSVGEARVLSFTLYTPNQNRQGTWNWGGYSNPKLDALVDESSQMLDPKARHAKLREAMRVAMEDVAAIPLHYQSVAVAARDGLTYETYLGEYTMADSLKSK